MATVVDRSRISERLPGSNSVRVAVCPASSFTLKQTVPTGFSAEAFQRSCGHRLGDRFRHRAVGFEQFRIDAE